MFSVIHHTAPGPARVGYARFRGDYFNVAGNRPLLLSVKKDGKAQGKKHKKKRNFYWPNATFSTLSGQCRQKSPPSPPKTTYKL